MSTVPPPPPPPPNTPDQNTPATTVAETNGGGPPTVNKNWKVWHTLFLLVFLGVFGALCWYQPPVVSFLSGLVLLTLFLVIAGHGVVGEWLGVLIDERNRMSMSRLQTALWTVVVLSGFLAAAVWNVRPPDKSLPPNPPPDVKEVVKLDIRVPVELWMVMGISVTSLAGSPLIRSTKMKKDGDASTTLTVTTDNATSEERALARQADGKVYRAGRIACLSSPASARLADLFQGEQTAESTHLDLGKVQVFFFTALLVFAYTVMLVQEFSGASGEKLFCIPALPALDKGMVALLGISHAGYLANKAVDKGPK